MRVAASACGESSRRDAAKLRRLLSTLDGEDYPAEAKTAYRQLRQATLSGTMEIPDVNLEHDVGDFVLYRGDGMYTYQLAVVVDDAAQGVTDVVRGADLLDSTPRQIYIQQLLGLPTPHYRHHPLLTDASGRRLAKRDRAQTIRAR